MTPTDERLGIVRLSLPDGRTVPLRFTWARIDAVGREWIVKQFETIIAGKDGCQAAMAEMLAAKSRLPTYCPNTASRSVSKRPLRR